MADGKGEKSEKKEWTFLSNHAHVMVCLAQDPDRRVRDIANSVGITERAVVGILGDLEAAGFITRGKRGRRNVYTLDLAHPLRHELEAFRNVADLVGLFTPDVD